MQCELHHAWNANEPDARLWKKHYLRRYKMIGTIFTNVLCVGDRVEDGEAVQYAFRDTANVRVIKLLDEPTIEQTIGQLQNIGDVFHRGGLVITHCI